MGQLIGIILVALLGLLAIGYIVFRWVVADYRRSKLRHACALFHRRREWYEVDFLELTSQSGKPRGLSWADCEFDSGVAFARDRRSGELRALVGVTICFEAVAGGGMEDVEAVGNRRAATAVFRYVGQSWITDGRAIFNLDPLQTIQHFRHELERISS